MERELLSDSTSDQIIEYGAEFERLCPYFMSIGMGYTEYWDGDATLPKYYLRAEKLRRNRENQALWLQGKYFYDAILCASPVLHALKKQDPIPYPTEPYPLSECEAEERKLRDEKRRMEKFKLSAETWAKSVNRKMQRG